MSSSFTTSLCRIEATNGTHRVKILAHSLTRVLRTGDGFQCGKFAVGDHQWTILYYPQGRVRNSCKFYLQLLSEAKDIRVVLRVSLVDKNGVASSDHTDSYSFVYHNKGDEYGLLDCSSKLRSYLDQSKFDNLVLEFSLKIVKPYVEEEKKNSFISVPPSNMYQHLHHLLQSGEGADISFKVKSETFAAHRNILAARSSVFWAELFGSMRESKTACIEIRDMEPQVFKALLQFIYTDMLPPSDHDHTGEGVEEHIMAQHLIVAADRYDLDRLKLICAERLAKKIGSDNVVTTLALAAQHNCQQLKEICLDHISTSEILHSLTEIDVFASLVASCPYIYKELLDKVDSNKRT